MDPTLNEESRTEPQAQSQAEPQTQPQAELEAEPKTEPRPEPRIERRRRKPQKQNPIFAFLRSRFTANALVYLLMNIGIGVLPYILLFFRIDYSGRLDAHSLPGVICLIVSVITFLGLVIFRGRALKNEIVKRLHM